MERDNEKRSSACEQLMVICLGRLSMKSNDMDQRALVKEVVRVLMSKRELVGVVVRVGMIPKTKTVTASQAAAPAHYTLKIKSYSTFVEKKIERYESSLFESGGHKWRLCLYPSGRQHGKNHLSLYVAIAETESLPAGWEVFARFKMFVFNKEEDEYYTIREEEDREWRYHDLKKEWGFEELIPRDEFEDESNGYLVDDCCVFGVEVFVVNNRGKGETVSLIQDPMDGAFTWDVGCFLSLSDCEYTSSQFTVDRHKWVLSVYPQGVGTPRGKYFSFYLKLCDGGNLAPGQKLYVEYKLGMKNQLTNVYYEREGDPAWFSASSNSHGFDNFFLREDLKLSNGYLVNTSTLYLAAQIKVISHVTELS
ncbi:hypothetical protein LguiA_027195 [Lonicera macranthoides]